MKAGTLLLIAGAGYLFLKNSSSTSAAAAAGNSAVATGSAIASGLPSDATLVTSINAGGISANVYMSPAGYYAGILNGSGQVVKVLGPYSQSEVYMVITAANGLGLIPGSGSSTSSGSSALTSGQTVTNTSLSSGSSSSMSSYLNSLFGPVNTSSGTSSLFGPVG